MRCFFIEPNGDVSKEGHASWPGCERNEGGNHWGEVVVYCGPEADAPTAEIIGQHLAVACRDCGAMKELRITSSGTGHFYRRVDTGEVKRRIIDFGPGAMWFAPWYRRSDASGLYGWDWDNLFEPPLLVKTPSGGDWNIDSRASNCTMPDDRFHRCWIRHGQPPDVSVDKAGITCQAGAGSIISGNYHGFLRNGIFT